MKRSIIAAASLLAVASAARADAPQYTIVDLGTVGAAPSSQAFGIASSGAYVAGRSVNGSNQPATVWTTATGQVGQGNLVGRTFGLAYAVNSNGTAAGVSTTTAFGSSPLPMVYQNGVGTQLAMPDGQTAGRAYAINDNGLIVGSVGGGVSERAVVFNNGAPSLITTTAANGSYMTTAYGVSNNSIVIGNGVDPNNAALNVGLVYNPNTGTTTSVGSLASGNGALAFGVSASGVYVVGSSMLNQGAGVPYLYTLNGAMTAIPLPTGTSQGSAYAVNSSGWAVGTASSAFAIPFLYDGTSTYRLADLLPAGSGWDLSTNTSASARGISENGTIVGTAVHNGLTHAYALVPVPEPTTWALMLGGLVGLAGMARRRRG